MFDYESMVTRQRKWMLYLLAIMVLGAGFLPHPRIFNGLILGAIISFYNLWLLQHKTTTLANAVAANHKVRGGLGTFSRLAAVMLAVLIALRFEEHFHIIAVVVGIVSSYVVLGLDLTLRMISYKGKNKES
ncbi:ATP synthase subunit I [Oceanobacillus kapialis]|uniref:ATP synthase subunit I n=1 Tax=Oceanobacillus kapialis TaxID=481353 RepID=A0ABW5Q116_9BACI